MSSDSPRPLKSAHVIYEPVLLCVDDEGIFYQAGAFHTEREAQQVLDIWRDEGRTEEMAINLVTVYESAEQWNAER